MIEIIQPELITQTYKRHVALLWVSELTIIHRTKEKGLKQANKNFSEQRRLVQIYGSKHKCIDYSLPIWLLNITKTVDSPGGLWSFELWPFYQYQTWNPFYRPGFISNQKLVTYPHNSHAIVAPMDTGCFLLQNGCPIFRKVYNMIE